MTYRGGKTSNVHEECNEFNFNLFSSSGRLKHAGFHIARYPVNIARYTMLSHKKEKANPKRWVKCKVFIMPHALMLLSFTIHTSYEKLVTGANRFSSDGLNSLKYKLLDFQLKPLYTWIHVEITPENVSWWNIYHVAIELHSSSHSAELIDTPKNTKNMKNIRWSRRLLLILNLLFIYRYSVPYEEKDKIKIVKSSLVLRNDDKAD